MSGETFQFLHASDFHLDQPPSGLAEIPDHLRDAMVDGVVQAATRVFEAAILEDVEFVVLSGDVIDVRAAGPRTIAFLLEQFEQLHEQRISVYWAGGQEEAFEKWPEEFRLPPNVHRFPADQVKQITHCQGDQPLANILGVSRQGSQYVGAGDFRSDSNTRFTVAVAYGDAEPNSLAAQTQIDYWALGGRHQPATLFSSPKTAHYCGSPQGRSFDEPGKHGCTLVQVDRGRKVKLKAINTDVIDFRRESLAVGDSLNRNELQRQLRARMQRIASETTDGIAVVHWNLQCIGGPLTASLRTGGLNKELLDWLRSEFGRAKPAVWTTGVSVEGVADLPEALYEEDTILGDFLRAIRAFEADSQRRLDFSHFIRGKKSARYHAAALELYPAPSQSALLREVAEHGVDWLRGDEAVK